MALILPLAISDLKADTAILAETARLEREYPMQKIEPAQFENLFEERLELYNDDAKTVPEEKELQIKLSSKVAEANAAFVSARKGDSSTKDREQALQRLENAYAKYKEIVENLDKGREFYNGLAGIVSRFTDDCRTFAYQRRVEAGQIETYVPFPFFPSFPRRLPYPASLFFWLTPITWNL